MPPQSQEDPYGLQRERGREEEVWQAELLIMSGRRGESRVTTREEMRQSVLETVEAMTEFFVFPISLLLH